MSNSHWYHFFLYDAFGARLAKRREILIFPRTVGNTGNSRELLGNWSLFKEKILNIFYNTHTTKYAKQKMIKQSSFNL